MSQQQPQPRHVRRRVHRLRRRQAAQARIRVVLAAAFGLVVLACLAVGAADAGRSAPAAPARPAGPVEAGGSSDDAPRPPTTEPAPPPRPSGPADVSLDGATATSYQVRQGDTLSAVAALHATSTAELASHNDLAPPFPLRPGQRLAVPFPEPAAPAVLAPPAAVADAAAVRRSIERWAPAHAVPADLLAAVLWRESRWDQQASSDAGATGVGQLMPATATWVADELIGAPLDPGDVDDNVRLSSRLLRWLIDEAHGDQAAAVAAYYQGSSATRRDGWYAETAAYVASVFEWRWRFAGRDGAMT